MTYLGIDLGTSGARAVAMTPAFEIVAQATARLSDFGADLRDPKIWWQAVEAALGAVLARVDRAWVHAIAVDGTSGTLLPVDAAGTPLAGPLMYDDKVADAALLARIAGVIPPESGAHGATSGLAKALVFQADGCTPATDAPVWLSRSATTARPTRLRSAFDTSQKSIAAMTASVMKAHPASGMASGTHDGVCHGMKASFPFAPPVRSAICSILTMLGKASASANVTSAR